MSPSVFIFIFGIVLIIWGIVRIKTDFKKNKQGNNFIQLILSGQSSGIGQVLSGVVLLVVGVVVLFLNK